MKKCKKKGHNWEIDRKGKKQTCKRCGKVEKESYLFNIKIPFFSTEKLSNHL